MTSLKINEFVNKSMNSFSKPKTNKELSSTQINEFLEQSYESLKKCMNPGGLDEYLHKSINAIREAMTSWGNQ